VKAAPITIKRRLALGLAIGLVVAVALFAATTGLGRPGVPDGAVAIVDGADDGEVTREAFDRAMEQTAARLGLEQPPEEGSPEFEQVRDEAVLGLIQAIWVEGEIADRGIEVTEQDAQEELEQIREGFENPRQFQRAVRQSRFCTEEEIEQDVDPIECEDVQRQGRLIAVQRRLVEEFSVEPEVTDRDVERFYEANAESFESPASRDVRVILNEDLEEVEAAQEELEGLSPDDEGFEQTWRRAAREHSQDQASRDRGGLLEGLVEGQGDPQLEEQAFAASEGELVGPFETDRGHFLIQVVGINEATTQPLEEAEEGIRQQLQTVQQQAQESRLQDRFVAKWTARTVCDEIALVQACSNYVEPEPEAIPGQPDPPQPPPVQSTRPIEPGSAVMSFTGRAETGQFPQRPRLPLDSEPPAVDPSGLPPGAMPIGPEGAPEGVPPDAVPPDAVPPDAAPPPEGAAPPEG
jgi:parvulin-like peptidyl-prolyl isomerase